MQKIFGSRKHRMQNKITLILKVRCFKMLIEKKILNYKGNISVDYILLQEGLSNEIFNEHYELIK